MENSIKARETVEQIGMASVQLTHGCELVVKNGAKREDIEELAGALFEMHRNVKELLESMTKIDPALDHDGDTQPGNEKPERKPYKAPTVRDVPIGLDPMSAGAIVMRNYGFSLQEVADVGALLLFMQASTIHRVVSDYRISARDGFARVETLGECKGVWEGESVLAALQAAIAAITEHTARGFPTA